MIVMFEGPDGSGKTILLDEFRQFTNYRHVCVDRMHLSHLVYSDYYGRFTPTEMLALKKEAQAFLKREPALIVYVTAEEYKLRARIQLRGESVDAGPDLTRSVELFGKWIALLGLEKSGQIVRINTTEDPSPESLARIIVAKIKGGQRGK